MKLKVVAMNYPDVFDIVATNESYVGVGGFEYEFLNILSRALKFSYEIVKPETNAMGSEKEDGNWTGLIGMLQQGKADMVIERMPPLYSTTRVVDYSFPYNYGKMTFGISVARETSKDFVFLYPFRVSTWLCTFATLIVCTIVFCIYRRVNCNGKVKDSLFSTFELLIGSRNLRCISTNDVMIRIFLTIYLLLMSILTYCYKGLFLAFLLAPVMDPQIDTLSDLILASKKGQMKIITYKPTYRSWLFPERVYKVSDASMTSLRKYWDDHPQDLIDFKEDHPISLILKGYAFVGTKLYLQMISYQAGMKEKIHISTDSLFLFQSAIVFKKNFCCKKKFNQLVTRILQAGIYNKILKDSLFRSQIQEQQTHESQDIRSLHLTDVIGALWIVLPCYVLSILVFCLELFYFKISLMNKRKKCLQKLKKKRLTSK